MTTAIDHDDMMRRLSTSPGLVVPRIDWDRPPWNRWAFQHIREILPTAEVWRGSDPPVPLTMALRDLDEVSFTRRDGTPATLAALLDSTFTDGFIAIHGGRVVVERYMNGMTPRTLHLSQSVAKSVVGTVAGILIGEGKLDPGELVTTYLPELAATAYTGARLQHVLDMTSGVRYSEEYTDRYSDVGQTDVASGWKPVPPGSDPGFRWPGHMWEQILGLTTLEAEHGSRFLYRSIETDVLAFCMERVSGRRLPQLVSEKLWSRIGADESASFTVDPAGYALASGGFNATLRDYARFGLLHLGLGTISGKRVVPESWIIDIRRGAHGLANDYLRMSLPNGLYRNQFWIEDRAREAVMCRGVFGQLIYIAPEDDLVVVKLSSYPDFLNLDYAIDTLRCIRALAAELNGRR